ncbi:GNAT family N-acetyltransferase [Cohnella thailandensis]|uniref:GNAT family N-acetyltransferase n=1 Tax=Cohnella thailandensis TaxID=557557 RepID=A0A841SX29_9BACL|nr:GNAT family N-acetyltransferase [Cohnella thailandensis]MBB6633301.1 GNAT family N-acetyltransferase [Cohnella thailandensis]MBP1977362.1 putative acetyltransferase [Cohnella thailandensis]
MLNQIVPYQESYHDKLIDIWYRAVKLTHTFLTDEDIEFYHQMLQSGALRQVEIWLELSENKEPSGFIGLDGTKIEMLFIDPDYHRKGIGSRLIKHAEAIKGSHLQVDVNEQNDAAYAFYKGSGFVQTGRSELDGSGRPFPLLHLELKS